MDYKLAMQLKDTGFPQEGAGKWIADPDALTWRGSERVYVPTLEDPIEACGDKLALSKELWTQEYFGLRHP